MSSIFTASELATVDQKSAEKILEIVFNRLGNKVALASSFGAEDVVLIHMMCEQTKQPRIFTLDTGRLNQETYNVIEKIRERYGVTIEVLFPDRTAVEKMVQAKGLNSFYQSIENRKECCGIRKVEPLNRMLKTLQGWVTGLRRDQNVTREQVGKIEVDQAHGGIYKINPLADWSYSQVWDYIKKHNIPYNILHDRGYPSIGCAPCTRAIKPGEDPRAGRWWWEHPETKECGLHT